MASLQQILELTFSYDNDLRKQAENTLLQMRRTPNFSIALLELVGNDAVDPRIRQSASITFKNLVKEFWTSEDNAHFLSPDERVTIKNNILDLLLKCPPIIQKQLKGTISEIAKVDFPLEWESLIRSIVAYSQSGNFDFVLGSLQVMNSVLKQYRNQFKTDEILVQLKMILGLFQEPLLLLFTNVSSFVLENKGNVPNLVIGFRALNLMANIFFSLNFVDIPEYFEDHIDEWMGLFLVYLEYDTTESALLEHEDDEEKPGLLHRLQGTICECLNLYIDKYDVEFEKFLGGFAGAIWKLLTKINQDRNFGTLASNAIAFLTAACQSVHHKLFQDEGILKNICEQIIIPNMMFTEADLIDFQENPVEYIRRDIEGSDAETRRRSAFLLVKGLRKYFDQAVTNILASYINYLLEQYRANPAENWKHKNVCTFLVTALAVNDQTSSLGAITTNQLVPIMEFFQNTILPDLESFSNVHPVLQADTLKFSTTFRLQIPANAYPHLLSIFTKMLTSEYYVVNTYASLAIERYLTVRDPDSGVYRVGDQYKPFVPEMLKNLFDVIKRRQKMGVEHHSFNENDYSMRCVMRILCLLKRDVLPFAQICMSELITILREVSKNPQSPTFSHYLFESIAVIVKTLGSSDPSTVQNLELMLLPSFQFILMQDVVEYSPYVFQIMALLLELNPSNVSEAYASLFPSLLLPALWERTGNIPAIVRLLQAYLRKSQGGVNLLQYLEGILGIFQKLVGSKLHDHEGFYLIESIVQYLPLDAFRQYVPTIWKLLFLRLTKSQTGKFLRIFTIFVSLFCAYHSPDFVISSIDEIQEGVFQNVVRVWISNVQSVSGDLERKICSVGMSRLLTESPLFVDKYFSLWGGMLEATLRVILCDEEQAEQEDNLEEETVGYSSSFSSLAYGRKDDVDPFPNIHKGNFLATSLHQLSQRHPGKIGGVVSQSLSPEALDALTKLFVSAGIPQPFFA